MKELKDKSERSRKRLKEKIIMKHSRKYREIQEHCNKGSRILSKERKRTEKNSSYENREKKLQRKRLEKTSKAGGVSQF